MKRVLPLVLIAAVILLVGAVFLFSASPSVSLIAPVKVIGAETPVNVRVQAPHGVRTFTAAVEQDGTMYRMFEKAEPARRGIFFRSTEPPVEYVFNVGTRHGEGLKDGKARLVLTAVSNDLRAASASHVSDIDIISRPPAVSADGFQHYVNQGGSELVTFTASGYWTEAGVRVGNYTFRSFPMPGKPAGSAERFSLFAFPWDVPADTIPVVFASNPSGAEATARFWFKLFPKKFRARELPLEDGFLQKVVSELNPGAGGDLMDGFLKINRDMRKQNNQALADLRFKTEEQVLWKGPFYRLGKVESFFADQRSYLYKGKKVDQQMHLGFDLSDVQASPVKAANSGRVIFAGPLGIYGNCIVVDHGYGLQSIYGHLREIDVKEGQMVEKEQVMGKSGATGLAGGDHLHFSMQVDGVQVNPIEWWDDHWIRDRILSKLPGAK